MKTNRSITRSAAFIAILAAIALIFGTTAFAEGEVVSVSDDGLHIQVDFTAMENTDKMLGAIEAADVGAYDIDVNYQIGFNDNRNVLFTVNGYDPAWIIYEIHAPAGQVLDTLVLKIYGRICDFGPNYNAFAVFALEEGFSGSGEMCELNRIPAEQRGEADWEDYAYYVQQANLGSMLTFDTIDSVHEFDLSQAAKGAASMYIGIYQYTTDCPEWIEYQKLTIDATAIDSGDPATEAPAVTNVPATENASATDVAPATENAPATGVPASEATPETDNSSDSGNAKIIVPIAIAGGVVLAGAVAAALIIKKKKK